MNIATCYPSGPGATELYRAQLASARTVERHDGWIAEHEQCTAKTETIVWELRDSHIAERAESKRNTQILAAVIVLAQMATQIAIRLFGG